MWRPLQPGTLGKGKVMRPLQPGRFGKGKVMAPAPAGRFRNERTPESLAMPGVLLGHWALSMAESESSGGRTRTCDPTVNSRLLYQLSYAGKSPQREEKTYPGGG
jgi:hypothetical protein